MAIVLFGSIVSSLRYSNMGGRLSHFAYLVCNSVVHSPEDVADRLDWSLLRSFLAVAEAGSLAGAARELGLGQPTLGRHLDALESQLGLVLFERTRQGTLPTEAALSLLPAVRAMQSEASRISRLAVGRSVELAGPVRLTASRMVSCFFLPPMVVDLRRAHPEVEIEIVASDEVQNLITRDADIAVRMVRPEQSDLIARRVNHMALGAFAAPCYLDRRGVPQDVEDLMNHDLLGFDRNPSIVDGVRKMGFKGVHRRSFPWRTDDQLAYLALVRAGAGIGFIARPVARAVGGLREVVPELGLEPLPMWLVSHRELRSSVRIQRVMEHLATALAACDLS